MKTTVKVNQSFKNGNHQVLLIENTSHIPLEIDLTKEYQLEIKELKSTRSNQQNKYMWALIHEIAKQQEMDDIEVYIQALEESNAKYEYVLAQEEAEEKLRKGFRAVKVVRPEYFKGKQFYVYKCFLGSSKFNISEMKQLIDVIVSWCHELGIPTDTFERIYGVKYGYGNEDMA